MAWSFGDSFDLYAAVPTDAIAGYWDSGAGAPTLVAGRFAGSQALQIAAATVSLTKSSGVNDTVHHLVVAFRQTAAISGTTLGAYLQLLDGTTGQCAIVFRSDGAILLTSGSAAGTTLATYTGAFPVTNTWYAFEIEVKIDNAAGSFTVRKNGNSVADFTATALDTQISANAYANKLTIGMQAAVNAQQIDDLFWRSDASSVAWLGDIRCYARMPASDASVTFSRLPTSNTQTPFTAASTVAVTNGRAYYTPFTAAYDGTISSATVSLTAGYTGNLKCSIFASSGSAPTTVLGSANGVANPATGSNALTFGTPVAVVRGTQYWIGFDSDTTSGTFSVPGGTVGLFGTTAYASFPVASPASLAASAPPVCSLTIVLTANYSVVADPQQDALTSYVYDSNPGDADFYGIGSVASTPTQVIATTTRAYMQKSDAGTRTAAVQLKSGATTVASPTLTLSSSGWLWAWRTDLTDPNTGAAWTPAAVNSAQIGPKTIV